jgi:dTDP-4-amino-4,6-dideoxygalactose transaminase
MGIIEHMARRQIGCATYFTPHLAEHPYFRMISECLGLSVTEEVFARTSSLPFHDTMMIDEIDTVCAALQAASCM